MTSATQFPSSCLPSRLSSRPPPAARPDSQWLRGHGEGGWSPSGVSPNMDIRTPPPPSVFSSTATCTPSPADDSGRGRGIAPGHALPPARGKSSFSPPETGALALCRGSVSCADVVPTLTLAHSALLAKIGRRRAPCRSSRAELWGRRHKARRGPPRSGTRRIVPTGSRCGLASKLSTNGVSGSRAMASSSRPLHTARRPLFSRWRSVRPGQEATRSS